MQRHAASVVADAAAAGGRGKPATRMARLRRCM
jgi:hypothetical protein